MPGGSADANPSNACVTSLSSSGDHTCAVTRDHGVWCWGNNASGQIGDGTTTSPRPSPTRVFEGGIQVSAGADHTCMRDSAGAVWCWGLNNRGQLGLGDTMDRSAPTVPIAGLTAVDITGGLRFTCARDAAGTVSCWGHNYYGQLGDGAPGDATNRPADSHTPIQVINLPRPATAISGGDWHACALLDNGEVQCWGYNCCGQLGNAVYTPNSEEPYSTPSVTIATGAKQVTTGSLHSCALIDQGSPRCWGKAIDGALGYGGSTWQWSPIAVTGLSPVAALSAAGTHTCAVTETGELWCWGLNSQGEVGDGTMMLRLDPQRIALDGVVRITGGANHVVAVTADDRVWSWGANALGQLGDGSTSPRATPGLALLSCDGL